jgi:uncharacterized protein (UPF0332 family)
MKMLYTSLLADDTIRRHDLLTEDVALRLDEVMSLAERHLSDAVSGTISVEARHNIAYAAARVIAEAVMLAEGYRPGRRMGKHAAVFRFLAVAGEGRWNAEAGYFDRARKKRNESEYERTGTISEHEMTEIISEATRFLADVSAWLAAAHLEYGPRETSPSDTDKEPQ